MVRLDIMKLLEARGKTKYWLYKQMGGMSYQTFNRIANGETTILLPIFALMASAITSASIKFSIFVTAMIISYLSFVGFYSVTAFPVICA